MNPNLTGYLYDNDTVEYYLQYYTAVVSILNLVADVRLRIFLSSIDIFVKHQNSKESKYDS